MIEATLTLAALLPLACLVAWRVAYRKGHMDGFAIGIADGRSLRNIWRVRAEKAEAKIAATRPKQDPKTGRFVSRRKG